MFLTDDEVNIIIMLRWVCRIYRNTQIYLIKNPNSQISHFNVMAMEQGTPH